MLSDAAQGHAHGNAETLADYGAFQKNIVAVQGNFARYDAVGQLFERGCIVPFIGHSCDFCEDRMADFGFG